MPQKKPFQIPRLEKKKYPAYFSTRSCCQAIAKRPPLGGGGSFGALASGGSPTHPLIPHIRTVVLEGNEIY